MPFFPAITDEQLALIERASVFFVATADPEGRSAPGGAGPINLSPRGGVPLVVVDRKRVAWLDHPGSGNETARHSAAGSSVTVMLCSFEERDPAIVRLYGRARAVPLERSPLAERLLAHPAPDMKAPRQVIEVEIASTQTSCGYGVPVMHGARPRTRNDRGRRYKDAPTAPGDAPTAPGATT